MKIGISDPDGFTFSQQLQTHWESLGHEVKRSLYHETSYMTSCDAVFYDFASNAVEQLSKEGFKPKRCVVRAIDIENYHNYCQYFNWDLIDAFIVLNQAQLELYQDKPDFHCPPEKIHIIQMGIDLNKYTLRGGAYGKNAVFVGRLWIGKNVIGAINIIKEINKIDPGWTLHIRGSHPDPNWWDGYFKHKVKNAGFPIVMDGHVDDMNAYLDDKDLMLVPSFKEAFSYVAAEALAKGIPALINDWYGAKTVWDEKYIYDTEADAIRKFPALMAMTRNEHREYVKRYDERVMFDKIDKLMGL